MKEEGRPNTKRLVRHFVFGNLTRLGTDWLVSPPIAQPVFRDPQWLFDPVVVFLGVSSIFLGVALCEEENQQENWSSL